MPELPEVEIVKRGLEKALTGASFTSVEVRRPDLRIPFPVNLAAELENQPISAFERRGKYIWLLLGSAKRLVIHLGMSGRILILSPQDQPDIGKHDHLVMDFDNKRRVIFNDPRRFGMVMLLNPDEEKSHKSFCKMGPEPLGNAFSDDYLYKAIQGRKTPVKVLLLDQRIVAGIGNIYASEALFYAGIDPLRPAGSLTRKEVALLVPAIRKVLLDAIEAGGSTLKDYRQADGNLGYFQHRFAVYDRAGQPCPGCECDVTATGGVQKTVQGGRATYYCAYKQC